LTIECGYLLRKDVEGKPTVFHGEIDTVSISGEFYLIPHASKRNEKSPDYAFKIKNRAGDFTHFGNAWAKQFKAGKGEFFSITVDGPGMGSPVYVAAFPDDDQPEGTDKKKPANYTIKWGRKKAGAPATVGDAGPGQQDDEIPY